MIFSLIGFIGASFPVIFPLTLGNLKSIKRYRNAAITWKYSGAVIGSVLFLVGIAKMINVIVALIKP
jgi:hypothetical protein